jgi:hypothetical protein
MLPVQTPQRSESYYVRRSLLSDAAVIAVLVVCLFASAWAARFFVRFLLPSLRTNKWGAHPGLVTFSLLGVVRGIFVFVCGYLLARFLRRVSPWHVVVGLAILSVILVVWVTPWSGLSLIAAHEGTTVPIILIEDAIGPLCLFLFLSLGIWCQRRGSHKHRITEQQDK